MQILGIWQWICHKNSNSALISLMIPPCYLRQTHFSKRLSSLYVCERREDEKPVWWFSEGQISSKFNCVLKTKTKIKGFEKRVICFFSAEFRDFPERVTFFFSGGASGNEPACQCMRLKRCRFDPWVGKIPWRREWLPTPIFLPGESHGQRILVGYSPWNLTKSDMIEAT